MMKRIFDIAVFLGELSQKHWIWDVIISVLLIVFVFPPVYLCIWVSELLQIIFSKRKYR